MAKKRRTSRKPGRKEALAVIILAMLVGLARQMLAPSYDLSNIPDYDGTSAYAVIDRNQPSFTEENTPPVPMSITASWTVWAAAVSRRLASAWT